MKDFEDSIPDRGVLWSVWRLETFIRSREPQMRHFIQGHLSSAPNGVLLLILTSLRGDYHMATLCCIGLTCGDF